jgi:hypothetical protein
LGVKLLKFFDEDPGSGMETVRIRDPGWKKVGSGINIPDPPHWMLGNSSFGSSAALSLIDGRIPMCIDYKASPVLTNAKLTAKY